MYFYLYLKGETILISKTDYLAEGFCSIGNQKLHGSFDLGFCFPKMILLKNLKLISIEQCV